MERAFERIATELREGEVVCIFPEGKLTSHGELNTFRAGIERIVRETPVPVVPMVLTGLWGSMFSRKERSRTVPLPRTFRPRLHLEIGEPLAPGQVTAAGLEQVVSGLLAAPTQPGAARKLDVAPAP